VTWVSAWPGYLLDGIDADLVTPIGVFNTHKVIGYLACPTTTAPSPGHARSGRLGRSRASRSRSVTSGRIVIGSNNFPADSERGAAGLAATLATPPHHLVPGVARGHVSALSGAAVVTSPDS
jgi:hypothetical protein